VRDRVGRIISRLPDGIDAAELARDSEVDVQLAEGGFAARVEEVRP